MVTGPQLHPPKRRITVHSLRILNEALQSDEQPVIKISANFRDEEPKNWLKALWIFIAEKWFYWLWGICTWGEPRMLLVTNQRLLIAVALELSEIPFASIEDIKLTRTWTERGMRVGKISVTYDGGQKISFRVTRPEMIFDTINQAWSNWKHLQKDVIIRGMRGMEKEPSTQTESNE